MANALYEAFGGKNTKANDGGFAGMIGQIMQFQKTFRGDARAEVDKLVQSGELTKDQLDKYMQIAQMILRAMQ